MDLSFGTTTTKDNSSSGFGFGGWGSNWNSSNKWDAGADSTDLTDSKKGTKDTSADSEDTSWSFGGNKKNKKKTTTSGFDFGGFGTLDEGTEEPAVTETTKYGDDDDWGGFMSVGKKDKKKKKGGIEDVSIGTAITDAPLTEPATAAADDSWAGWGSASKKDKKKGKKDADSEIPPPPPPPPVPVEPAAEDEWSFGSKKEKKKSKKVVAEDPWKAEESAIVSVPETAAADDEGWGSFAAKKDKKKTKKGVTEENTKDDPAVVSTADTSLDFGTPWSFDTKADKKSKKGGITEVVDDPVVVVGPTPTADADDDWMNWGAAKKKDKKGKKGTETKADEPLPPPPPPVATDFLETAKDDIWGTSAKKDKKGKKGKASESEPAVIVVPEPNEEGKSDPAEDDWGTRGLSSKDKKKKEKEKEVKDKEKKKEEEAREKEKEDEKKAKDKEKEKEKDKAVKKGSKDLMAGSVPDISPVDDTLSLWGTSTSKKDKKKKGGKEPEAPPPAPTPPAQGLTPEPEPALDDLDDWGSFAPVKAKGKKDVKKDSKTPSSSKTTDVKDPKIDKKASNDKATDKSTSLDKSPKDKDKDISKDIKEVSSREETPAKAVKSFWGGFGSTTTKAKTTNEKEKEKEEEKKKKEDAKLDEIVEVIDESPKKASKSKVDGKLSKTSTKESEKVSKVAEKKAKEEAEKAEEEAKKAVEAKKVAQATPKGKKIDKKKGEEPKKEDKTVEDDDEWGTWNSSKNDSKKSKDKTIEASKISPKDVKNTDAKSKLDEKKEKASGNDLDKEKGLSPDSKDKKADGKDDAWSFWGSSKKPSGKKGDEPKKEITKPELTNQKGSLGSKSKEPEPATAKAADEATSKSTKASTTMLGTKSKLTGTSSVAEKIKALEKEKLKKSETKTAPPAPELESLSKNASPPTKIKESAKSKSAGLISKSASVKKKDLSPPSKDEKKNSKDSVPGSFPGEGGDDDVVEINDMSPLDKKSSKKSDKLKKDSKTNEKKLEALGVKGPPTPPPEPTAVKPVKKERARVVRDEGAGSWGFWGAAPKSKEVKRERKSKDDTDVTPAKEKSIAPGLGRSKSMRTSKEKEKELEKTSGSSNSDKEKKTESRPSARRGMSLSGMFGAAPPPTRTKSVRRTSGVTLKDASRRQSVDVGALGMPSPPPDDEPAMNSKAAKLMGTTPDKLGRKPSTRGKQKAKGNTSSVDSEIKNENADLDTTAIPDPYAIDDDDMVIVNPVEDPVINAPVPKGLKDRSSKSKAKRDVGAVPVYPPKDEHRLPDRTRSMKEDRSGANKRQSKYTSALDDDIVMVDAGPSNEGSPDDPPNLAFQEKSRDPAPPLKRSATGGKKSDGIMGGLFGFSRNKNPRRASETFETSKSNGKGIYSDDEADLRRKRTLGPEDDGTKRLRRSDKKVRRSDKGAADADATEGFTTDAVPTDGEELTEARRKEERRSKRASKDAGRAALAREEEEGRARDLLNDKAATEARKAKIREARDARIKEDAEKEAMRKEDKASRKAAKEDRDNAGEGASRDITEDINLKKDRRSSKILEADYPSTNSRPHKSDRRRSAYMEKDPPIRDEDPDRRRRVRRSETDRPSASRRKSTAPTDYFDPRHASRAAPPTNDIIQPGEPIYGGAKIGGNDHTSSWVNSIAAEPPPPPPVEGTVLDAPNPDDEDEGDMLEDVRKKNSKHKRRSRYVDPIAEEQDDRPRRGERESRRRDTIRSSEGSGEVDRFKLDKADRRKSDYMSGGGIKTFDGRDAVGALGSSGKRGSFFKKLVNL